MRLKLFRYTRADQMNATHFDFHLTSSYFLSYNCRISILKNRSYSTVKIEVRELSATNAVQLYLLGLPTLSPKYRGFLSISIHYDSIYRAPLFAMLFAFPREAR